MNGLIPKRSCVNPVLITTFGLEPPGQKNEGEGAEAVERSDRKGLGNAFPNETEGAVRAQKEMRVKTLISFCAQSRARTGTSF